MSGMGAYKPLRKINKQRWELVKGTQDECVVPYIPGNVDRKRNRQIAAPSSMVYSPQNDQNGTTTMFFRYGVGSWVGGM